MGYLLGAFGKQMAGSRYRSIQARMMKIQSRARKASRDVKRMEDMITRQEKAALNNLTLQSNIGQSMAQQSLLQSTGAMEAMQIVGGMNGSSTDGLSAEQKKALADYQMGMSNIKTNSEQWAAMSKMQIEDYFQQMRDQMLEPLKDEEELLQTEKDALESELQIAKNDYDACKQMEKDGAQMLKPEYTAGGN
ncbi:hypothetical protein IJ596_01780 [bacterium]|nr:hypothetical protein [bacterium]